MSQQEQQGGGRFDRRAFLKAGGAATAALLSARHAASATAVPPLPVKPRDAAAMPTRNLGPHRLPGRDLQPRRPGGHRAAGQRGGGRPDRRAGARPRGQLHRHLGGLRRARALERALHRPGDEAPPPRRSSPSKTHDRTRDGSLRLLEQSLQAAQHRPPRPVADPQPRHASRRWSEIFAHGRRHGGARSRRASRRWCGSSA